MPSDKVLVAGGAGFIGSHLIDRLLADGKSVICVDNLSSGSLANLSHVLDHPRFEFIEHDVLIPLSLDVGAIYNLACPASPLKYQQDPLQTIKSCVLGAINLLDLAVACGCVIFQASTSEVYGDPLMHPQSESYFGNVNPIGRRACYDEGKRCAETLFFDYHRTYGVAIKVARIFNTYGPRMRVDDGRVIPTLLSQAMCGSPLSIFGSGEQTRSFCYVDDLVEGIVSLTKSPKAITGPINLGNPTETAILEIAKAIISQTGSDSTISFLPLPEGDPQRRRPDISRAQEYLGWSPRVELDAGLAKTLRYFVSPEMNIGASHAPAYPQDKIETASGAGGA